MPNLSKVAADLKKVDEAVRILNTTPGVNVKRAMITAGFPKTETTNETLHRPYRWGGGKMSRARMRTSSRRRRDDLDDDEPSSRSSFASHARRRGL